METPVLHISFTVPQGWHELPDKQLRYAFQLIAQDLSLDETKTLCLLHSTGTRVIGRQDSGSYLLKKGKYLFEDSATLILESAVKMRLNIYNNFQARKLIL